MIKEADLDGDHEISFAGDVLFLNTFHDLLNFQSGVEFKKVPRSPLPFISGFY